MDIETMAPVSLPCVMGTEVCSFKTKELEYEYANKQLGTHMKFAHGGGSGTSHAWETNRKSFLAPPLKQIRHQRLGRTLWQPGHSTGRNTIFRGKDSFASYMLVAQQTSKPACPGLQVASNLNKLGKI